MKALLVAVLVLAGCAAEDRPIRTSVAVETSSKVVGRVVSAPMVKAAVVVEEAPAATSAPSLPEPPVAARPAAPPSTQPATTVAPTTEPPATTVPPRDLLAECRAVVTELLPLHPPAPGWADPVCHEPDLAVEAQFGRSLQGYTLWTPKTIHLTPTEPRLDLRYLYLHEVGHSWCASAGVFTEECADAWARAA